MKHRAAGGTGPGTPLNFNSNRKEITDKLRLSCSSAAVECPTVFTVKEATVCEEVTAHRQSGEQQLLFWSSWCADGCSSYQRRVCVEVCRVSRDGPGLIPDPNSFLKGATRHLSQAGRMSTK